MLRALDLFCGGGGAALGLIEVGFEVVGVDLDPRHARVFPGQFICGDALRPPVCLDDYDLVWASPPCQAYSSITPTHTRKDKPALIPAVRALLKGHPYSIIENVPLAPLRPDIRLAGPMVGLPRIRRIRHFECSFFPGLMPPLQVPPSADFKRGHALVITTSLSAPYSFYARKKHNKLGRISLEEARAVMGINTPMNCKQVGAAVPPAYARFCAEKALWAGLGKSR